MIRCKKEKANDNVLLTLHRWPGYFSPFAVCCVAAKEANSMAKRRANGEGNLRKRKDGRWEGRYTAGRDPETGKAIYKNVLGKTQAEAKAKLKAAIEEAKGLDAAKVGRYTVGQWMEVWFEHYAKVKVRPSSHQTYPRKTHE